MLAGLILVVTVLVISRQMSSKKQRKTHVVYVGVFKMIYRQSIVQEGEVPTSHLAGNRAINVYFSVNFSFRSCSITCH